MSALEILGISLLAIFGLLLALALVKGVLFEFRAALAGRRGVAMFENVPNPRPTPGLALCVALDELLLMPMGLLGSMSPLEQYERSSSELDAAVRFYQVNGWLDDPATYFTAPPIPGDVQFREVHRRRGSFEELRFASAWQPHQGEPGGERWRSFHVNDGVLARVLRHGGGPRPWLICLHGQGMGRASDIEILHMRRLHSELGVNVLLPVLPMHGPRWEGLRSDKHFVSNVYPTNNVLGLSQAMWDLRKILAWLREREQATSIGVFGFSLGSYAASLLATLDGDLACVIAVVPSGDLAESLRTSEPALPSRRRKHRTVHDRRSALAHRVVSPLAKPCLVPKERRFIIAGQGDRVAPPPGAVLLWRHWEECTIHWRPRGHLTTGRSAYYDDLIAQILRSSGLVDDGRNG